MRLYAPLLITLLAVGARAASIPDKLQPELEKKLVSEEVPPAENISQEPELVDPANTVIDVENNLKKNVITEDIPVKVIVEEAQSLVKTAEAESANDVTDEDGINRPLADLRNPGPPQHQEHETQNPEHYGDMERAVSTVKDEIQGAQVILRQGFQGVTDGIQNWYANNEQIINLQNSINSLEQSFASQVQKLNNTLQNFLYPDSSKPLTPEQEQVTKKNFDKIESDLKTLDSKFKSGVKSLSEGVQVVATLKEEGETPTSGSTTSTAAPGFQNPFGNLLQMVGNLQTLLQSGFGNVTQAVNNMVTQYQPNLPSLPNLFPQQTTPAAVHADEPVDGSTTTQRPSPWQNIQNTFNNLFNPNQQPQGAQNDAPPPAPTGPLGLPPFPIITSIVNFIQRPGAQSTEKPTAAPAASTAPAASNDVPPVKPEEIKPDVQKIPDAEVKEPAQKAVESIPTKPSDEDVQPAVKAMEIDAEKIEDVKIEAQKEEIKPEIEKEVATIAEPVKAEELKEEEKDEGAQVKGHRPGDVGGTSSGDRIVPEEEQKATITEEIKEEVKETEVSDKTE